VQVETSVGLETVWATLTDRQAQALRDSAIHQYFQLDDDDLRVGAALARKGLAVREREWHTADYSMGYYATSYHLTDHGTAVAKHLNQKEA
jgi:hypothetical protein